MPSGIPTLIIVMAVMMSILGLITMLGHIYNLNGIKSKTVGDGQHGTSRWATRAEIKRTYRLIRFTPKKWRAQAAEGQIPTLEHGASVKLWLRNFIRRKRKLPEIVIPEEPVPQGLVVGCHKKNIAIVDTGDVHALMLGAAGVGKTAYWLYPCIEYALASGMSFLSTDTKGDIMRNYGNICKTYGYNVAVIDLRNPTRSCGNNLLYLVLKYMDLSKQFPDNVALRAKAEKYAKIISKTIILSGMDAAS